VLFVDQFVWNLIDSHRFIIVEGLEDKKNASTYKFHDNGNNYSIEI